MATPPVDVVLQNEPPQSDIPILSTLVSRASFLNRDTRAFVDPDAVQLTVHAINNSPQVSSYPPSGSITKVTTGVYTANIGQQPASGKLRITWQALDGSGMVVGSGQSILQLVAQSV